MTTKLTKQQQAIFRVLKSYYPAEVPSDVLWERLHWIKPSVLKVQVHYMRRDHGLDIVGVRGKHGSFRLASLPR